MKKPKLAIYGINKARPIHAHNATGTGVGQGQEGSTGPKGPRPGEGRADVRTPRTVSMYSDLL